MKSFTLKDVVKGTDPLLQSDYENFQEIEGHLGCNWMDEYPRIKTLRGESLRTALQEIVETVRETQPC